MINFEKKQSAFFLFLGFLLKSVGGSWDASFHFKHLREFYQIPHILNGIGNFLIAFLLVYLWRKEPKVQHERLKFILAGLFIFVFGIAFDQWWHTKFGVDLTIWSPAHVTLYIGTLLALIGGVLYISRDYKHGKIPPRIKKIYCILFFYLILDTFWFPLIQQEQGVIFNYYLQHGIRLADNELFQAFFHTQPDIYGGIPYWIYGAWATLSTVLVFNLLKRLQLHPFAATLTTGVYLLFRFSMNTIYILTSYPTSTVPYYLFFVAIAFDILYNLFEHTFWLRRVVTCAVVIIGFNAVGFVQTPFPIHPPIPLTTLAPSVVAAVIGYILAEAAYKLLFHKHI